jgi:hypothetical protein
MHPPFHEFKEKPTPAPVVQQPIKLSELPTYGRPPEANVPIKEKRPAVKTREHNVTTAAFSHHSQRCRR